MGRGGERAEAAGSGIDLERAHALLARIPAAGPRYTSYPTAPVWNDRFDAAAHARGLAACASLPVVSLYTHIPFCRSLCHFCACNRVITRDEALVDRYLDAVTREIALVRETIGRGVPCTQLHWGGGTPTHLSPAQIERLYRAQSEAFPIAPGAERSIEVDPRVTRIGHLEALANCGFDRLSLGVQDTHPATQQAIHRVQPFAETRAIVDAARARGIERINFDLVYGLPHQTVDSFETTLDEILAAEPDRIALYGYAHVTWVAKQQRGFERLDLPDPGLRLRIQLRAIEKLGEAGYEFIGMDHFAKPDDELARALGDGTLRRNFMGYTTREGLPIVAFGPSGISELPGAYAQSCKALGDWFERIEGGGLATERGHGLSLDDEARRFVIGRVMGQGRVEAKEVLGRFGLCAFEAYRDAVKGLGAHESDGLVKRSAEGDLEITPMGRLFVRPVAMAFDAYLGTGTGTGTGAVASGIGARAAGDTPARFSQTV